MLERHAMNAVHNWPADDHPARRPITVDAHTVDGIALSRLATSGILHRYFYLRGDSRGQRRGCQAVRVERAAPDNPPEAVMVDADRWRAAERRRRKLAERLAWELAHPDPDAPPDAFSDLVAATAVQVRWASAVDAQIAFDHAPRVIALGGRFGRVEGRGGVILCVHCLEGGMDDWSLIVPYEPFTGPVLVCVDDLQDHCMWISEDDPQAREALSRLRTEIELAFTTRAALIADGGLPPD